MIITPSDEFIRPADTTAYASGDLVANSTTAAVVIPLKFSLEGLKIKCGVVGFVRLFKDDETTTAATFTLHLFAKSPTVSSGDNAALAIATAEYHLGEIACDMSSNAFATSTDIIQRFQVLDLNNSSPSMIAFDLRDDPSGDALYGLLEAGAAYTPASGERFRVWLEIGDDHAGYDR